MFFEKKVDRRSKKAMVDFLLGHRRYYTANDLSRAKSYANCVKFHTLGLSFAQCEVAWMVLSRDYWSDIWGPADKFKQENAGQYSIGFNGRTRGYLVLYSGEYYDPGYKSQCLVCGQLGYMKVEKEPAKCERCGQEEVINLRSPLRWHRASMRGVDDGLTDEDFMEFSMAALRDRVDLVCRFDRACDEIRDEFIKLMS